MTKKIYAIEKARWIITLKNHCPPFHQVTVLSPTLFCLFLPPSINCCCLLISLFHAIGLFLHPPIISENQRSIKKKTGIHCWKLWILEPSKIEFVTIIIFFVGQNIRWDLFWVNRNILTGMKIYSVIT